MADSSIDTGPKLGDAFGALLMKCWQSGAEPGKVFEFIERDDGYMAGGDAARYFAAPEAWGWLDRWACEHARGRVLDIGCGAGRHALYLQDTGLAVTALDVSPLAAEVCRQRGVRQVVTGTVADLPTCGEGPFDTFLLLGNNLGLLSGSLWIRDGDAESRPNKRDFVMLSDAAGVYVLRQMPPCYRRHAPPAEPHKLPLRTCRTRTASSIRWPKSPPPTR